MFMGLPSGVTRWQHAGTELSLKITLARRGPATW
jgi:hypothetical protein